MKRTLIATALLTALPGLALATPNPKVMPDDSWISIKGTAVETAPSSFLLDYGQGQITVEMDDWSWIDQEAQALMEGDEVTVYGEVDDNFSVEDTIEASSVYVESLGRYFYANSADEEEVLPAVHLTRFVPNVAINLSGNVTEVSPGVNEFTIDNGIQRITVDTSDMAYDPLDDKGFQQIEVGDRVSVAGWMDEDILDSMQVVAESVVTTDEWEG
ncbi:DUF5666 domain-containing protein [Marinospirillum perlucidum]|uniref:DUF5666 domain-containing protein n=1 Tax=Marinospirillum perlucidum TaxID=1982602 RepID=UPI000DF180C0|nr:DUF5666 domain-containing protein [Marinospirillum perlucidum]